ncbi:hypothetical protein A2U01_0073725, partial [Trifolium medium]|nr:hypothetical protein [Trifolium medium]
MWRGAPLKKGSTQFGSGGCALRMMVWRGAPLKNSKRRCVMATCALRRTYGA